MTQGVLEARIAGALSPNPFDEILDSVTFGRRLRARFVVRAVQLVCTRNRDDRSQLQACFMSSGMEWVAPSGAIIEATCTGMLQSARARNQNFREGVPTQRVVVAKVDRRRRASNGDERKLSPFTLTQSGRPRRAKRRRMPDHGGKAVRSASTDEKSAESTLGEAFIGDGALKGDVRLGSTERPRPKGRGRHHPRG